MGGTVGGKQRSLTVLSAVLQLPCPTPLPAGLSRVPFAFPLTGDEAQSYEGHQFAVRWSPLSLDSEGTPHGEWVNGT